MERVALLLNLIASLVSGGWGVIALIRPDIMARSPATGSEPSLYARLYAARAVAWGVSAGLLPFVSPRPVAVALILTAGVVQLADMLIALARHDRKMATGAASGAAVHALCGVMLF